MAERFRSLVALEVAVVVLAFAVPLVLAADAEQMPPPVQVFIADKGEVLLDQGTTLGEALKGLHIKPKSGSLIDVDGKVLRKHAYPGSVTVNGARVTKHAVLHTGDRIAVISQHNRREPLLRQVVQLPGRQPENPQFYLGTVPGEEIVVTGRISDKIVSSTFRATGPIRQPRAVALTFDDGPNPLATPRILGILHRMHVHATFFTIGYLAVRYPDLIKREQKLHMMIGDHSWDHPTHPPFGNRSAGLIRSEIKRAADALNVEGVNARFFRPPGGSTSDRELAIAQTLGMRVVLWSVDPQDWRGDITTPEIVHNVLSNVRPGSIVIMHDGGGDQTATIAALPKIIRGIRKKHLALVAIG